jgi:broad specificity phosphatase PhoE
MRLIVIRHGQTVENATGYLMGHNPGQLTKLGKEQAKSLGKRLAKEKIDLIYCSDLKRTKDTLKEVLKYHRDTPVIYSSDIRERNLGVLQGTKRSDLNWDKIPGRYMKKKPKGGESLNHLKQRANKFLNYLKTNHPKESVFIMTHGGVLRILNALLSGGSIVESFKKFKFENTSISEYEIRGDRVRRIRFNDNTHAK